MTTETLNKAGWYKAEDVVMVGRNQYDKGYKQGRANAIDEILDEI